MKHLFINGTGASAGGGLTYLKNILPHLSKAGVCTTIAVANDIAALADPCDNVEQVRIPGSDNAARRYWLEQIELPRFIRKSGADALLSAGNFALRNSPVPQILLSRNSLYTSPDFSRDLIARGEYRMWVGHQIRAVLAKRSINWAHRTVAPSQAFARDLENWSGHPIIALHHGFDRQLFFANPQPLPDDVNHKLNSPPGTLRALLVSHYNYYRNFETVFRAIADFVKRAGAPPVCLFLTCELERPKTPGAYNPEGARRLIERLGIRDYVVELGAVPYEQLHHVYGACDVLVTAAYTETFAHPLVEAMSSRLPVVASDLPVHREICGDTALYFARFSPAELASHLMRLASADSMRAALGRAGQERAKSFSWQLHVEKLLQIADELLGEVCGSHTSAHSRTAA